MRISIAHLPYLIFTFCSSVAFERGLFVLYLSEKGYSAWQISILQITLFASSIVAEMPTGMLADFWGRKRTLQLGSILMASAVYGQFWSGDNFAAMLLCFAAHGISFALISGSGAALLYDNLEAEGRTRLYLSLTATTRLLAGLALGISMAVGGFLQVHSWHIVYTASTLFYVGAAIAIAFVREHAFGDREKSEVPFRNLLPAATQLLPLVLPFALMHAAMTPYFIFSQKVFEALSFGATETSLIIAITEICGALLTLGLLNAGRRWSVRNTAPVLLAIIGVLLALNALEISVVSVGAYFMASSAALFLHALSLDYIQSRIEDSRLRASLLSAVALCDALAIGVSYLVYGFLLERFQPGTAVAVTAFFPVTGALLLLVAQKKENR